MPFKRVLLGVLFNLSQLLGVKLAVQLVLPGICSFFFCQLLSKLFSSLFKQIEVPQIYNYFVTNFYIWILNVQ